MSLAEMDLELAHLVVCIHGGDYTDGDLREKKKAI
jgi:hypothetical protein